MKPLSFKIAVFLLQVMTVAAAYAADPVRYLTEIGHIPLMPGVSPVKDTAVLFDKPEGRIAQTVLVTRLSPGDFLSYYGESLPPLGWKKRSSVLFEREDGVLSFEIDPRGPLNYITVRLVPPVKNGLLTE